MVTGLYCDSLLTLITPLQAIVLKHKLTLWNAQEIARICKKYKVLLHNCTSTTVHVVTCLFILGCVILELITSYSKLKCIYYSRISLTRPSLIWHSMLKKMVCGWKKNCYQKISINLLASVLVLSVL